jgi:hypothetical protein
VYILYTNFTGFGKNPLTQIPQSLDFYLDFFYTWKMADPESESVRKAYRESRREVTKERTSRKKEKREDGERDKSEKQE